MLKQQKLSKSLLQLVLLGMMLLPGLSVRAQEGGWSRPVSIDDLPGVSQYPRIVVDAAGKIHIVYTVGRHMGWQTGSIYYITGDGTNWSEPVRISTDWTEEALLASLAIDSQGMIHVVYACAAPETSYLFYTRAYAGGTPWLPEAWSSPVMIAGRREGEYFNDIVVDAQDTIHVVYEAGMAPQLVSPVGRDDLPIIFYVRSTDGGDTWSQPLQLSHSNTFSNRPRIAVDDQGTIHVVWADTSDRITGLRGYYTHSTDGGESWMAAVSVSENGRPKWMDVLPDHQGRLHISWGQAVLRIGDQEEIRGAFHQISSDGGLTWSAPQLIAPNPNNPIQGHGNGVGWTDLGLDSSGVLHAIINDYNDIYYAYWDGESWSPALNISHSRHFPSLRARMAVGRGNTLHVAWSEQPFIGVETRDLFYTTRELPSPRLEGHPYPTATPTVVPAARSTPTAIPTPTRLLLSTPLSFDGFGEESVRLSATGARRGQAVILVVSGIPVLTLFLVVIAVRQSRNRRWR